MERWQVVLTLLASTSSLGCAPRNVEEDCRAMCKWADECDEPEEPGCVDNCVENMKDADDECRDALGDFADCVEDHPECGDGECGGEAAGLLGNCIDEFD